MRPSPLQLDSYFVTELNFEANLELTEDGEPVALADKLQFGDLKTDVKELRDEVDPWMWTFELTVHLPKSTRLNYPYSFQIVLLGFFRVDSKYPEDKVELLAKVNGPAMLYSAAREALETVTGRGPHQPLLLPSANFLPTPTPERKRRPRASTEGSPKAPKRKKQGTH